METAAPYVGPISPSQMGEFSPLLLHHPRHPISPGESCPFLRRRRFRMHGYGPIRHHCHPPAAQGFLRQISEPADLAYPAAPVRPMNEGMAPSDLMANPVPLACNGLGGYNSLRHRRRLPAIVIHPYLCTPLAVRCPPGVERGAPVSPFPQQAPYAQGVEQRGAPVSPFPPQAPYAQGSESWSHHPFRHRRGGEVLSRLPSLWMHMHALPFQESTQEQIPEVRVEEMDDIPADFAEKLQLGPASEQTD